MRQIDGIVFDKDGTLFDFGATWGAWTAGFIRRLVPGDDAAVRSLASDIHYDLETERHLPGSPLVSGTLLDWIDIMLPYAGGMDRAALFERIVAESATAKQIPAAPLAPLLSSLKSAGYRLGVATNDGFRSLNRHLDDHEIAGFFDFVAGYDSGHGSKPAPGMLLAFARATELAPGRVLMVGDSLHDLDAARAAGMRRVAVLTGAAPEEALRDHAEAVLGSIVELPNWLQTAE